MGRVPKTQDKGLHRPDAKSRLAGRSKDLQSSRVPRVEVRRRRVRLVSPSPESSAELYFCLLSSKNTSHEAISHRTVGQLANSQTIMRQQFFFGNHNGIGPEEREY